MNKNNKKFRNKKLFITRLVTLTSFLVFMAAIITSLSISTNKGITEPGFTKYTSYYDGSNVEIVTPGSADSITTITMTRADELGNNNSGKIITIESADELALFSTRCKSTPAFLGYSYKLISNISWSSGYFNTIGSSDNKFTGTFDGQGYQIDDLTMNLADNANPGGIYYSMFNYVGSNGKVKNLGLSHPVMTVADASDYLTTGGVSYLVGENAGTVENCFVVDDGDAFSAQAGIYAAGGVARIAGLIVNNKGTFSNCYIATSAIYNIQLESVAEYNEVCLDDSGSITNVCFFNDSIKTLTVNGSKATISYKSAYKISDKENDYFGTYEEKESDLIASFESANGWYTKNDYGAYKDYTGIKYAIHRGISLSGTTFTINDEYDFAYMYELFNTDDKFASNELTYVINANLNLAMIPVTSYTYKKGIGSTIKGASSFAGRPIMANNSTSAYPTIYNVDVMNSSRIAVSTGVDCYGLFNYLTGTVENLNVVPNTMNFSSVASSNNAKGIGALSGYIEGGTVKNVNVYLTVSNTNSNIGEYYLGGITGILGGNGKIGDATSAGTFTLNQASTTLQAQSSYMGGVAIGGVVGYIENSNGAVYNTLNSVDITSYLGASAVTYAIGGVIGAGYTMDYDKRMVDGVVVEEMNTGKLENVGTITVGSSSYHSYGELYVAGIIGRHTGELNQVSEMTNKANISVYANGSATYVAGVENADIKSTAVENTKLEASQFVDSEGNKLFYASSLANGAEIVVSGDSTNLEYTNVINIKSGNNFRSKLSDIYNLAYSYVYAGGSSSKTLTTLAAQTIDLSTISKFSGALNVIGGSRQYSTIVETIYNLRAINFTMNNSITSEKALKYAGVALGSNISFNDARNEGNLTFTIDKTVTSDSTLKVSGVFEEISEGSSAYLIFNGGDITFDDRNNVEKKLTIFASGICHSSNGVISDATQSPLNQDYDSSLKGSLDSAINNGKISIESAYINANTSFSTIQTTNYQGNIYFSGVAYENSGIISNTFNLGDIFIGMIGYEGKEYFAAGISNINKGQYAQIRDTANNGEIRNIIITNINVSVRSAGISITNDNDQQVVSFVINYGTIYAFSNKKETERSSNSNGTMYSQAGGILTVGICNIVNVVNYGNVYANANAGGMIAKLIISNPTETIKIANAINYGNVMSLKNYYTDSNQSPHFAKYSEIKAISNIHFSDVIVEGYYNYINRGQKVQQNQFDGALIGIANYNNKNKISIRYLINFSQGAIPIVADEFNKTNVAPDTTKLFNVEPDTSMNQIMNGQATYAPLSTEIIGGNIGVFNKNFTFRRAIEGDSSVLVSSEVTDRYLSDFFQFIPFKKVNENIIEIIGWKSLAYQAAAEEFMKKLDNVVVLLNKVSSSTNNYSSLVADATTTDAWLSNCNTTILRDLFDEAIESGELSNIKEVINYVLYDADSNSGITTEYRTQLINLLLKYIEEDAGNNTVNYYNILNALLYDELLANIISGADENYANIKTQIQTIINGKTNTELEEIVVKFIGLLDTNPSVLNPLFDDYSPQYLSAKREVLNTLLIGFTTDEIAKLHEIVTQSAVDVSVVKYYSYLLDNPTVAKNIFSNIITQTANETNTTFINAMNAAFKQYNLGYILEDFSIESGATGYNSTMATNFDTNTSNYISNINYEVDATTADYTSTARDITSLGITPTKDYVALWNKIKNNKNITTYLESILGTVYDPDSNQAKGIYAPATEYNNSYQSVDGPAGSDNGLTMYTGGTGIERQTTEDGKIANRFIYTPDEVVSYGTHYYGPYTTKNSNTFFTTATNNRYLDLFDTGTNNSNVGAKYIPVFISIDRDTLYNKISNTARPTVYEFIWNDPKFHGSGDSASQWVSKVILDKVPADSTDVLFKNYSTGDTYQYGGETVTTQYMMYGYDFNPALEYTYNKDRAFTQTIPGGTYTYRNFYTNQDVTVNYSSQTVNLIGDDNNGSKTDPKHKFRNHYITGYVSASLVTGVYYNHSIWTQNNVIQGVFMTAKSSDNKVKTSAYINYFIDDLINLDGVRTKGLSDGRVSWDECNIINALVARIMSTSKGKDVVLHALAEESVKGITDPNLMMILLKTINVDNDAITFRKDAILSMVLSYDTSVIRTTLGGYTYLSDYLQSLVSGQTYTATEEIVQIGSVDKESFIRIIKEVYEYSKYSEKYREYTNLLKSTVNDYIYTYVNDMLYNESDSDITTNLSSISDADLTKINNMFSTSSTDSLYISEKVVNGFTIWDSYLYTAGNSNYPNAKTYDSVTYNRAIIGVPVNEDNEYVSTIMFTTGDYEYGYTVEIVYEGSKVALFDETGDYITSSNTITRYTRTNLTKETYYYVCYAETDTIYSVKVYKNAYDGYSNTPTYYNDAVTPFALTSTNPTAASSDIDVNTTRIVNRYSNYYSYSVPGRSSNSGSYSFTINKATNVTITSASVSFKVAHSNNTNSMTTTITTSGLTSDLNDTLKGSYGMITYSGNITVSTLTTANRTFTIALSTTKTNNTSATVYLYDIKVTYVFTLENGTTVTFVQDVLNSSSSTITFVNTSSHVGLTITSPSHEYAFPSNSGASFTGVSSALTLKPWYEVQIIRAKVLERELELSDISMTSKEGIATAFSSNYDGLSDYAKYLLRNVITSIDPSSTGFNLTEDSFVFIRAKGDAGATLTIDSITPEELTTSYAYYTFDLLAGNHTISATGNNISITNIYILNKDNVVSVTANGNNNIITSFDGSQYVQLFNADYSTIASFASGIDTVIPTALEGKTKYQTFVEVYPYAHCKRTNPVVNRANDIKVICANLFSALKDNTGWYIFDYNNYDVFTLAEVKSLINLVASADYDEVNSSLDKLIVLANTHYSSILGYIVGSGKTTITSSQQASLIDALKKIRALAAANNYSTILSYYKAAYVGDNYVAKSNSAQLTTTIVKTLLTNYSSTYDFISSNSAVDGEKYNALLAHLGFNTSNNDTYGIYALSSSEGIGNGIFIPDNLTLSDMDKKYATSNGVLMIKDTNDAEWRGGETISSGAAGTVDYAFYHDMKQIKKSISTNIFELNINNNIYSVDDQIDNNNHIVTYYVSLAQLNSIYNQSSITISKYSLANNATLSSTAISMTGAAKVANTSIIIENAFIVYAEDTTVYSNVTLKFYVVYPSGMTLTANPTSIGYAGGEVTLTLTGTGLPDGMDVEPYISISVGGVEYKNSDGYWKFDKSIDNNCIVKNDSATINIIIDKSLPGGTNAVQIVVNVIGGDQPASCTITKTQNTGRDITSFGFVPFGDSNQEYSVGQTVPTTINSTIPYGRAYNYEELTDYTSENFYLYKFSISDNAKVVITATKELVENSVSGSSAYGGLMKYTVTYTITPETNGAAKTYRHILTESQYFTDGAAYATIYADGNAVTTAASAEAYKALPASERPNYLYDGTLVYNYSDDMVTIAKFKSTETYYKISYSAKAVTSESFTTDGSLYTLSNGVYNKVTSGTYNSGATYYERNYAVNNTVTLGNFTTDGSLFTLDGGKYLPVYNGTYSNSITYYSIVYEAASPAITAETFTSNGSLFTRSGEGTQASPYIYTKVIDKRSLGDDMYASVAFNRTDEVGKSIEPQYRIKYSLSNFYTLGSNVVFGTTESTLGNLATTNITYAGLTVTVSENNDTGTYKFIYTYTNTGLWKDGEVYSRYYEFPEFIVEKHASTDALIHKLTFLEEAIVLGNTATVILPDTPLVPDKSGEHYGSDDQVYGTVFNATNRKIVVSSSGVRYTDNTDAVTISDYYAIGTVSDADLSYYCPTFEVNEFAEIYQYTTYKKLTSYGMGRQTETDSEVLSVHDNIYLYVPYEKNNEITILLVEVDSSGYWRNVYTTDFAGDRYVHVTNGSYNSSLSYYTKTDDEYSAASVNASNFATLVEAGNLYFDCLVGEYPAHTINNKNAKKEGDLGNTGYSVSERAGEEADNSSLYMDYVGTPLDGHFWYVSYVVFSEDYISGGDTRGNVRYYHISIIDATNNVQFEVTVYTDTTFNEADIYLTISENTYKKTNDVKNITGKRQISAFADESSETYTGTRASISGFKIYKLKYDLQTLPGGFFYFYVDLPDGYVAEAYTDKSNNLSDSDVTNLKQNGAFDPATSIITIKIKLEIVIKKGTAQDSSAWAVNTTDIYTRQAEYKGTIPNS